MSRYVLWFLLNGTMMGTFLLGAILPHEGLLGIGLVFVYVTILMGVISLLFAVTIQNTTVDDIVRKNPDIVKTQVNRKIDVGFDLLFTSVIAFFGYPILAVLYVIHIFGLHALLVRFNESKRRIEEQEEQ